MEFDAIAGASIGLGAAGEEGAEAGALAGAEAMEDGQGFDDDQVWYAADAIPNGTAASIALIEHRWAIPLRDAIVRADGPPQRRVDPRDRPDRSRAQPRGGDGSDALVEDDRPREKVM